MSRVGDTIVAVSSPPGRSARGLVRLTGDGVVAILGELLAAPPGAIDGVRTWPVSGRVVPWRLCLAKDVQVAAMVGYWRGPGSYTGQDVAELQVPGNPVLLSRLVGRVVELGARPAEAGEFTFRAYAAGKLDLTQAEGVAATIGARSTAQLRAAAALAGGELRGFAEDMVTELGDSLALVEAGIDFVDQEDVVPIAPGVLDNRLAKIEGRLRGLLDRCGSWSVLDAVPRVVLMGLPSVGKSTLFNALLGQRRAVVAEQAGTTRDVLEEVIKLPDGRGGELEVMLVDVAGLDDVAAGLNRQVQEVARTTIEQADVALWIDDGRNDRLAPYCPNATDPHELSQVRGHSQLLRVRTKADLAEREVEFGDWDVVVSGQTGQGLDGLRAKIVRAVGDRGLSVGGEIMALRPRHEAAVRNTQDAVRRARELLAGQTGSASLGNVEIIAAAMREGLDEMANLGGRMTPDDVIGRVFSTFCVGK